MRKIKMTTWSELMFLLKRKGMDIKDYDYIEGRTTDSYMESHPHVMVGRRFYDNPYLWGNMIEQGLDEAIDFILSLKDYCPDLSICRACIHAKNKSKYTFLIIQDMISKGLLEDGLDEATQNLDFLLEDIIGSGNVELYDEVVAMAKKFGIPPKYGIYANAAGGHALMLACDNDTDDMVIHLLDEGADAGLNDSLAFTKACKKAKYGIALRMVDKGADIHTKNDLGLKMIERNDKNNTACDEQDRKALLSLYDK